jgi:flagellar biosynthesis/type III secretory pathway M-ring protein FliF/YscJ
MLLMFQSHPSGGSYWEIIVVLGGVIATMALFIMKREMSRSRAIGKAKDDAQAQINKAKDDARDEVNKMLRDQIKELRDHKELVSTLLDRIDRKPKGG